MRSREECQVWAMDRRDFKHIIKEASEKSYQKQKNRCTTCIYCALNENQLDVLHRCQNDKYFNRAIISFGQGITEKYFTWCKREKLARYSA